MTVEFWSVAWEQFRLLIAVILLGLTALGGATPRRAGVFAGVLCVGAVPGVWRCGAGTGAVWFVNFLEDKKTIVRVFPLEDYRKIDPDEKMDTYNLGVLYVKEDNGTLLENEDDVFKLMPAECDGNVVYSKEPILVESKPVPYYEDEENSEDEISSQVKCVARYEITK